MTPEELEILANDVDAAYEILFKKKQSDYERFPTLGSLDKAGRDEVAFALRYLAKVRRAAKERSKEILE